MKIVGKTAGDARSQKMGSFTAAKWSGNDQLWWTGQEAGAELRLEIPVPQEGEYQLETSLTRARDYAIVQLLIDDKELGRAVDCFVADRVDTTGLLKFGPVKLTRGPHVLTLRVVGKNARSTNYMVGLDFVRIVQ